MTGVSITAGTTTSSQNNTSDAQLVLTATDVGNVAIYGTGFYLIDFWAPGDTSGNEVSRALWRNIYYSNTNSFTGSTSGSGEWYAGTNITGLRFFMSSGNITSGQCTLYGYQK